MENEINQKPKNKKQKTKDELSMIHPKGPPIHLTTPCIDLEIKDKFVV